MNLKFKILETLLRIGAIRTDRLELLSDKTRDNPNLHVYRDYMSRVIFIKDFYVGDVEYTKGDYRKQSTGDVSPQPTAGHYEDLMDSERQFKSYRSFIAAKEICDFGCGAGSFLKLANSVAKRTWGVELQDNVASDLGLLGIECYRSLDNIETPLDVITLFHCLEHLPDPTHTLIDIHKRLKQQGVGKLLIEVPHAKDFLLEHLNVKEFIDFTLWSQHLVLHTRESLTLLLKDAGFKNVVITGIQRYGISNHIHWLKNKQPGGHRSVLSAMETPDLKASYENALARIDATDTLVAIATT